ncbi:hypothetical protein BV25DRAFT_1918616 [Artomyces pyxidatus]|uniref:Uncharacterized protein n=1 Tax=Artomyces pyxidatus TaxID=48021 RepID=A0ACB8SSA2_9AGAM|nr:hypothetical protein BV25DRAFT_1918616 [Artomyces pyxidatus]
MGWRGVLQTQSSKEYSPYGAVYATEDFDLKVVLAASLDVDDALARGEVQLDEDAAEMCFKASDCTTDAPSERPGKRKRGLTGSVAASKRAKREEGVGRSPQDAPPSLGHPEGVRGLPAQSLLQTRLASAEGRGAVAEALQRARCGAPDRPEADTGKEGLAPAAKPPARRATRVTVSGELEGQEEGEELSMASRGAEGSVLGGSKPKGKSGKRDAARRCERREREKQRVAQEEGEAPLPQLRPSAINKHAAPEVKKAALTTKELKVANSAFVAKATLPPSAKAFERRMVALFTLLQDLGTARAIVDRDGRIVAYLAGRPKGDDSWDRCAAEASKALDHAAWMCRDDYSLSQVRHSQGQYPIMHAGYTHGGGPEAPYNMSRKTDTQAKALAGLTSSKVFERIAGFASSAFQMAAPRLFTRYSRVLKDIREDAPHLRTTVVGGSEIPTLDKLPPSAEAPAAYWLPERLKKRLPPIGHSMGHSHDPARRFPRYRRLRLHSRPAPVFGACAASRRPLPAPTDAT